MAPGDPGPERVLVVRRDAFFTAAAAWPQGWIPLAPDVAERRLLELEEAAEFVDRPAAESDPSLKQLIPYCAVTSGGRDRVLVVRRLRAQSEARLHGADSIGIGGHINPIDGSGPGVVRRALTRELSEELTLPDSAAAVTPQLLGLINDDSTDVGSVHVGLAFLMDLPAASEANVKIRETDKMSGDFRALAGIGCVWQTLGRLETWSRLLVSGLTVPIGNSGLSQLRKSTHAEDGREDSSG